MRSFVLKSHLLLILKSCESCPKNAPHSPLSLIPKSLPVMTGMDW